MIRVRIPPEAVRGDTVTVASPQTLHHLRHVRRVKPGDPLECVDGEGHRYAGRVFRCAKRTLLVRIEAQTVEPTGPLRVWLGQALIKPDRFDWVIQKATELGVDRLTPLLTARTIARAAPPQLERKRLRWQRIAEAACAQCGRAVMPMIDAPMTLKAFLPQLDLAACVIMPTLAVPAAVSLQAAVSRAPADEAVAALIGPEGDFTREEVEMAQRFKAIPVSLGRLTLRSDTAALATLTMLQAARGSL